MPVIGLTGSIASGKSLVTQILKELGAHVIDADIVSREVVQPGTAAWRQIRETFGPEVFNPDLTVNREVLADIVFGSPQQMDKLNAITHPGIVAKIKEEINIFRRQKDEPSKVLVIDAPLLIETGLDRFVDEVWLIVIPEEMQIRRLMERDRLTREQAVERIYCQLPTEDKMKCAQVVIDNSGDPHSTEEFIRNLWKQRFGKSGGEASGKQKAQAE